MTLNLKKDNCKGILNSSLRPLTHKFFSSKSTYSGAESKDLCVQMLVEESFRSIAEELEVSHVSTEKQSIRVWACSGSLYEC